MAKKKDIEFNNTSLDALDASKLEEIVSRVMKSKKGSQALKSMVRSVTRSAIKSAARSALKSPLKGNENNDKK